jgi:AcrR family transcriptional regulator
LAATLGLLEEAGYAGFSVEDVAARAGVNKTTIYRNWPTRTALIVAAAEARSEALIENKPTGNPERDLVAFVGSVSRNATSPLGQALIIASLNEQHDPDVRSARSSFWEKRFDAARELVRVSLKNGHHLSDDQVDAVTERLIAPVYLRALVTGEPIDRKYLEHIVRGVVQAHGTPSIPQRSIR